MKLTNLRMTPATLENRQEAQIIILGSLGTFII